MQCGSVCFCNFYVYQSLYSLEFKALPFRCRLCTQTGDPFDNMGKIAPECIILSTSCRKPQFILVEFDRAWINLMHFPVVYSMCTSKLNLLSSIMPRYFIVFSWCNCLF